MNKLLTALAVGLLFQLHLLAQGNFQVSGKIVDANSKQPLQGASVFCQNTTVGTATNGDGEFRLNLASGGYDLVVSFTGYDTWSQRISHTSAGLSQLLIELRPKDKSIEAVTITASSEVKDGWTKYGQFFIDNFIGKSSNAKQCVLKNPEALRFFFNKKRNRLKVTGKEDLVILNNALGYTIRYQLDSFVHEYGTGRTLYTGYPFFEALSSTAQDAEKWSSNRRTAYYGSLLHFMRSYKDSTLNQSGYKIELMAEDNSTTAIYDPYDTLYFNIVEAKVELGFVDKLRIVYAKEQPESIYLTDNKLPANTTVQISILIFQDLLTVEQNGFYFDQRDLVTLGYMGWEKMGDRLPYDYYPQ